MRIISGKYKGRNIPVRKDFPSRPTTDFAKENLFNVLANQFDFEELQCWIYSQVLVASVMSLLREAVKKLLR
jgi:hypothetical protein